VPALLDRLKEERPHMFRRERRKVNRVFDARDDRHDKNVATGETLFAKIRN
jgi:hypothetical protein